MSIAKLNPSEVSITDLQFLVENKVRESVTLEFKRENYGNNDDARAEFLADVSAFANTEGGDLIIGISEEDSCASVLCGITKEGNLETEIIRLQNMAMSGIAPKLTNFTIHEISLEKNTSALLIRIGKSYYPPHRVQFKNRNKFYKRKDTTKYEPDVSELRGLFNAVPELTKNLRGIRDDRVKIILNQEAPIILRKNFPIFSTHFMPLVSASDFYFTKNFPEINKNSAEFRTSFAPTDFRKSFDGHLVWAGDLEYCLLSREGYFEVATVDCHKPGHFLADAAASVLVRNAQHLVPMLWQFSKPVPVVVLATLIGAKGAVPSTSSSLYYDTFTAMPPLTREILKFSDAFIEENASPSTIKESLMPILYQLANMVNIASPPARWLET